MSAVDYLILFVVAACIVLALRGRKKARDNGTGCCSCCTGSCPGCGKNEKPE